MFDDFWVIFYWWFLLFILGFSFLPLTLFLFQKFFDKGYGFAKIIALLIVSYLVWLLGSFKLLPFFPETVWLIIIAAAIGNLLFLRKERQEFKKIFKKNWKIFLFEELLFFSALTFWSFVRGFQPAIQGLEKFMDFGFVNSILRSRYFPPTDMWLAGGTINYYYFGHLISAVLTKMSGINPAITYNLMIATIFALVFVASFSLGSTLASQLKLKTKHILIAGLISAFLLTLGGNLHPLYWFLTQGNFKSYWYPDATRFIVEKFGAADNTIHEFPIYSFVVADLHGHMINIPTVLLILALVFSLSLGIDSKKKFKKLAPQIFLLAFCFAIAFMTNAWDYPIYLLLTGGAILLFNKLKNSSRQKLKNFSFVVALLRLRRSFGSPDKDRGRLATDEIKRNWDKALIQTGIICGFLVVGSFLLSLPFHLHFKSIAKGIALTDFHSPPWMLLVLWGFPLVTTISFLLYLRLKKTINYQLSTINNYFILVLLAVSWLLILIPEIVYVKDIYIHSHQRANTVFKLTYQSFVMFSLTSGYIIVRLLTGLKQKLLKLLCCLLFVVCCVFIFIYPYFAIRSYYGLKTYQGLYGLDYLKRLYPDDYQAILWLNKNISNQPTIVEAVGESYTDFGRVSANTGLPTILGWRVHEWLWRGSFDEAGKRTGEVQQIYESGSLEETRKLLEKYKAQYLFLGSLERKQYPNLLKEKFDKLGEIVYQRGTTRIYKLEISN